MTKSITCDQCGESLVLDGTSGQEDQAGEIVTWLRVGNLEYTWDACTRVCAHALIDGPVREVVDQHAAVVAEIARTVREERKKDSRP